MLSRLVVLVALAIVAGGCTSSPEATDGSPPPTTVDQQSDATPVAPSASTLVMWASGGLAPDVGTRAAELPGVTAAVHLPSDTLGLVGVTRSDGTQALALDDEWRIPIDVTAVQPALAGAVLADGPAHDTVSALRPGQALLTESAAKTRGVAAGATLRLLQGPSLQVVGVVPDSTLGRGEVLVHAADADALGMDPEGTVVARSDGAAETDLAERLQALGPADTPVRVDTAATGHTAADSPLVLSLPEVKERFGEFAFRDDDPDRDIHPEPAWVEEHISREDVPIFGRIRCHRAIFDDLRAALQAIRDAGLEHEIDTSKYGGCYHPRRIGAGSESLSRHSWGIAIDINVDFSQPGAGREFSPGVVEAFAEAGFRWGGLFLTPDNHHFEWVGDAAEVPPPPAGRGQTPS